MNIEQLEKMTRTKYEHSIVKITALPPGPRRWSVTPWDELSEAEKDVARSATRETIDAYLSSVGEGIPSVHALIGELDPENVISISSMNRVRNLLLSAFAKKMEAIAKLPEKWREDQEGAQSPITVSGCAYELGKALTSPLTVEPVPEVPADPYAHLKAEYAYELGKALTSPLTVEPVPEVPADPYAHLKAEYAAGRQIQISNRYNDCFSDRDKGEEEWTDCEPQWARNRKYRVKPEHLPFDKWSAEKVAHAKQEDIEHRSKGADIWLPCMHPTWRSDCEYRIAPDPAPTYHTPAVVQQRREEAAAINAAMNPAPAGKTDEQLGEIGGDAVLKYATQNGIKSRINVNRSFEDDYYATAGHREVFARAVREAVEKERADCFAAINAVANDRMNEISSLLQDKAEVVEAAKAAERETSREHDMRVSCRKEIARLTAEVARYSGNCKAMDGIIGEQQAELTKANAELERLRWRSLEVKPTREDTDPQGQVEILLQDGSSSRFNIINFPWNGWKVIWWRPFCLPPALSAEEKERAEFEVFWNDHYLQHLINKEVAFKIWINSRLPKEKP